MDRYILRIEPAIPREERHKIEDVLKELGYFVVGGITDIDKPGSIISFEGR